MKNLKMKNPYYLRQWPFLFILLSCVATDKEVSTYQTEKKTWHSAPQKNTAKSNSSYLWAVPKSWVERPGNSIRIGSFTLYGKNKDKSADLSVITLGGSGGGLVPNINRWREQLALAPQAEALVLKSLQTFKGKLGTFKMAFLKNKDSGEGMLVGIFKGRDKTLFIKAKGPLAVLEENREQYNQFVRSIDVAY